MTLTNMARRPNLNEDDDGCLPQRQYCALWTNMNVFKFQVSFARFLLEIIILSMKAGILYESF